MKWLFSQSLPVSYDQDQSAEYSNSLSDGDLHVHVHDGAEIGTLSRCYFPVCALSRMRYLSLTIDTDGSSQHSLSA
jgi:hypothetical protein